MFGVSRLVIELCRGLLVLVHMSLLRKELVFVGHVGLLFSTAADFTTGEILVIFSSQGWVRSVHISLGYLLVPSICILVADGGFPLSHHRRP